MGDALAEGRAYEGCVNRRAYEEEDRMESSFHTMVMLVKLWQAVCRASNREGVGCLLPEEFCTNTRQQISDVLQEKHPGMRVPPVENPTCAAFK